MFDQISKHHEVRQKYSATLLIFISLLGVWKSGETQFFVLVSYMQNVSVPRIFLDNLT